MKKSMTRLLSLALVLIMLVGMVPAALADDQTVTITGETQYTLKSEEDVATIALSVTQPKIDGYTFKEAAWTVKEEDAKLTSATGSTTSFVTAIAGPYTVTVALTYENNKSDAPENEKTKTLTGTHQITVAPYEAPAPAKTEVTISDLKAQDLAVGQELALEITVDQKMEPETDMKVVWDSTKPGVATIDENGKIKAVKAGETEISAVVTLNAEKYTIKGVTEEPKNTVTRTCKLTVTNDLKATLTVEGKDYSARVGDSIKVTAALVGTQKPDDGSVKYFFNGSEKAADSSTFEVTAKNKDKGVVTTTVKITYDIGGDPQEPLTAEIKTSFYDNMEIEVIANRNSFSFRDKNVFEEAFIGNVRQQKPETVTMSSLILTGMSSKPEPEPEYDLKSDSNSMLKLEYKTDPLTGVREISVEDIVFTVTGLEDTSVVTYEAFVKEGDKSLLIRTGTIEITCVNGGKVSYKTDKKTEVEFEENDFRDFWRKEMKNSDLEYVQFHENTEKKIVNYGKFYEDSRKKTEVKASEKYYYNAKSGQGDLDDLIYVPSDRDDVTTYTVSIPFTAYGSKDTSLGGIVEITIEDGGDIVYKTTPNKPVIIDEDDFRAYYNKEKKNSYGDFTYVVFDSDQKGNPEMGALYVEDDENADFVNKEMRFFYRYSKKDNDGKFDYDLDEVTYVPFNLSDKPYVDYVPFTCYGKDAEEAVRGVVTFEVGVEMPFKDVSKKDWFYEDVEYVFSNDIMNGTDKTTFSPNATLTRSMVVTMLWRIEDEPAVHATGLFKDVKKNEWYTDAVEWAAKEKIVNGYGDKFGPADNITRQDLAVILYRYYTDYKGNKDYSNVSLTQFSDYKQVAEYAEDALEWAVSNKIMQGDAGKLMPKGNATRAQAAAMFHRFLEMD